ncbi:DUF2063 domain-containing protein [Dyella sp. C9]|uniref:HvfC/BufC N-terminal domain-containing protein n=1 Tax=Dyella sp. C9 TaxID=2202154 RepID=UPI000DEF6B70|nr:DNA-binding domain-containing protein [Dyella sp. C9]
MHTSQPVVAHSHQHAFCKALLDARLPVPEGVIGPNGKPSERRFNVYRNNVVAGQVSTLLDAYPATARLVGKAFFKAMARDYVMAHPPVTPMMFDYGADFPAFIDAFPAAAELPYLGDVARIERCWVEAYHSAEASPLPTPRLREALVGEDLRRLTLQLHPSVRVLQSAFPALAIWEANTGSSGDREIHLDDGPEDILMVRPEANVEVHRLPRGGAGFFQALSRGCSLVGATERALAGNDPFDLVASMAVLVDARLVIGASFAQAHPNLAGG